MASSAKRSLLLLACLLMFSGTLALVHAHQAFRLTGKITKWDSPWMTMNSREHGTVKVKVQDDFATILHSGKPGKLTDIKVGHEIDVDGWGDGLDDLEALKVDIDPLKK